MIRLLILFLVNILLTNNYAQVNTQMEKVNSIIKEVKEKKAENRNGKVATSYLLGKVLAEKAKAKGVTKVKFDRGGYKYHGRVRALAEAARENGLKF